MIAIIDYDAGNLKSVENPIVHDTEAAITVGVEALKTLIREDLDNK